MPNTIPAEVFTNNLFELLDETFEKVGGRYLDGGTSLFETLAAISAEAASQPVSANCASLAAQVEHVRFYLEVNEHYLLGKKISAGIGAKSGARLSASPRTNVKPAKPASRKPICASVIC